MIVAHPREGPVSRGAFVGLLAAYLVVRLYLMTLPGYVDDVERYKNWAIGTALDGLSTAYDGRMGVDYPPLFLYPLYAVGEVYLMGQPEAVAGRVRDSAWLTFLVKTPHLVFDVALACLLAWLVGGRGLWGPSRRGAGWGRLVALLYLWNPAVLWDSAYWGQPDSIHSALALFALVAVAVDRTLASGASLSAAALMKPLAAPLVPLLAWAAALRRGLRGVLLAGLGGLAAAGLIFLPFVLAGRLGPTLRQVLLDVEAMPSTSVNAHNLWWILGPWRDANRAVLGFLTPKIVGLTLFGAGYLALLLRFRVRPQERFEDAGAKLFLTASAVAAWFFFVSTHMHENHLFMALPLLLAVAGRRRSLAWLALGCSVVIFFNCTLHDVDLPYHLPSFLSAVSGVENPHLHRPYTWLQLVGSQVNSVLAGVVAVGTLVAALRSRV